jgi:signal transduction histidine kinase
LTWLRTGGVVVATIGASLVLWLAGWESATAVLRAFASGLFLIAGVALLVVWRASGRTRSALLGVSLIVGGSVFGALQPFGRLVHDGPVLSATAPSVLVATGIPALFLIARCCVMNTVKSAVRPVRAAVWSVLAATAGFALVLLAASMASPIDTPLAWSLALLVLGGLWSAASAIISGRARSDGVALSAPLTPGLQLFAAIYVFAGLAVLGHPWALVLSAAAACGSGATLATFAASSLAAALRRQGTSTLRLVGELGDATQVLADEQARREELVHDARSAVASLRLANGTLVRYREQLDLGTQEELHSAFGAELGRLADLLDASPSHAAEEFDLAETVRPLVRLARDGGAHITLSMADSVPVHGVRRDTATVVHTLLTNATRYARGTTIEVRAELRAYDVRVSIADRGPGVGRDEREAVFRRGFRGASSAGSEGSGLGLFVARRLMADQDGGLVVEENPGGGACFVVTIPAARLPAADETPRAELARRAAS